MGINDEYSRDAYLGDQYAYNSDDDSDTVESQLDPEDWQAMYHEELWDAWLVLEEYVYDHYLTSQCSYHLLVDFLSNPEQCTPSVGTPNAQAAWFHMSQVPIVRERVQPGQFHTWFDAHIF